MATLNETSDLTTNQHLKSRIAGALAAAAEDVMNESDGVTNHAERFTWASTVLLAKEGPLNEADRAIWLALQNPTIVDGYNGSPTDGGTVDDGDVQFVVDSLVNILAGV